MGFGTHLNPPYHQLDGKTEELTGCDHKGQTLTTLSIAESKTALLMALSVLGEFYDGFYIAMLRFKLTELDTSK